LPLTRRLLMGGMVSVVCRCTSRNALWFLFRNLYRRSMVIATGMEFFERRQVGEDSLFNLRALHYVRSTVVFDDQVPAFGGHPARLRSRPARVGEHGGGIKGTQSRHSGEVNPAIVSTAAYTAVTRPGRGVPPRSAWPKRRCLPSRGSRLREADPVPQAGRV